MNLFSINVILLSIGVMHEDLQLFLDTNLPESSKKRRKIKLGVGDQKIGAAIQESMGFTCETGGPVAEIHRGVFLFIMHHKPFLWCRKVKGEV